MTTAAVQCRAIIHAWHGFSYDSRRPEGEQSQVDEPRNRISIKSQNYVGAELNPGFFNLVFSIDEQAHMGDIPGLDKNEISETFSMLMGL